MDTKSIIGFIVLVVVVFVIPYFWRQSKEKEINEYGKYSLGRIYKRTGSLKNGNHWHYSFSYNQKEYEGYKSTNIQYNVEVGDYFLIQFSSKNPDRNKIFYEYQLRNDKTEFNNYVGDSIPYSILEFRKSNGRFW